MKKLTMFAMLASSVLLSGCWSENGQETKTKEDNEWTPIITEEENVFPLTGKKAHDPVNRRAAAIVVNNHPQARPQTGLTQADIVYEVLAEGNVTRLLAIYQSRLPQTVGPVRSARDYFIDLAQGYNSLFVAHGYSPNAKERLFSGEVDQINGIQHDGTVFKRDSTRVAPHNSYVHLDEVYQMAEKKSYSMKESPESLSFLKPSEAKNLSGKEAKNVRIDYASQSDFQVEYKYDGKERDYQRFAGGNPVIDRQTEEPVRVNNILILEADHRVVDAEGRLDIDLATGGRALLLQNGVVHTAEWSNINGRLLPFKNGTPLSFVPGNIWIQVIPAAKGLNQMVHLDNN
ncbi:DUF3048 domain-containing protein [Bacillus xiapuensis]|uniref:DUF3048 domain-containing protein n=1 Tax=Bacillus xiapuensis TaxID=2014075 RepID=UPI000C235D54|nr:DUF3048 domain-containing protein [Bacillus xiapuensis]